MCGNCFDEDTQYLKFHQEKTTKIAVAKGLRQRCREFENIIFGHKTDCYGLKTPSEALKTSFGLYLDST